MLQFLNIVTQGASEEVHVEVAVRWCIGTFLAKDNGFGRFDDASIGNTIGDRVTEVVFEVFRGRNTLKPIVPTVHNITARSVVGEVGGIG